MSNIEKRKIKEKELIVEQFKRTPIVQVACEKIGIGRATFYRWKKEDKEFAIQADDALLQGSLLINDVAESQLIQAIKNQNLGAIVFWLKHHHQAYTTRLEVTAKLKNTDEKLTPEQENLVMKALKLAEVLPSSLLEDTQEKQP